MRFGRQTHAAARAAALILAVGGCSPANDGVRCPVDTGAFAFPSIAGGPVRKPGEPRVGAERVEPGHDHPEAEPPRDGAWMPGEAEIGEVVIATADPDGRVTRSDAWRPARTVTLDAWDAAMAPLTDDGDAARWLTDVSCDDMAEADAKVLWMAEGKGAWLEGDAWRERCASEARTLHAVTRCADDVCLVGGEAGGLVAIRTGADKRSIIGVLAGWHGDIAALKAFSRSLGNARVAPYESELGKLLSIEEAGRLKDVEKGLAALVAAHPDHAFLRYFLARNLAGQHADARAIAMLEALAASTSPEAVAARALAGLHAEWAHLRAHPRYLALQAELHRRMPDEPAAAVAWLIRFRRSIPHLNAALMTKDGSWMVLRDILRVASLYPARIAGDDAIVETPAATHTLHFGRDAHGVVGVREMSSEPPPR